MQTHAQEPPPPPPPSADPAWLAWAGMSAFVLGHDPTEELRRTLGLGRGTGRVKTLVSLTAGPLSLAELAPPGGGPPPPPPPPAPAGRAAGGRGAAPPPAVRDDHRERAAGPRPALAL